MQGGRPYRNLDPWGPYVREYRLLERIRNYQKNPDRRDSATPADMIKSVLDHVQKILNTKQGAVLIDDDYGLPDYTDIAGSFSSDKVQDLEREINRVIRKYEPRLIDALIEFEQQQDDVLALRFKIKGKLMSEHQDVPVVFESVVQSDGKIVISG